MVENPQPIPEKFISEPVIITPGSLLADNSSDRASSLLSLWETSRRLGNLTGIRKCGDARSITPLPDACATTGSIAAAGDFDSYRRFFNHQAFRNFIAIGHYDGSTLSIGKMPTGCGGLAGRAQVEAGQDLKLTDVQSYLEKGVAHPDVLVQTFLSASEISKRTDKPVLAIAQDHLDGTLVPFAIFSGANAQYKSAINPDFLLHKYNPEQIYKLGFIPALPESELPAQFRHILSEYQDQQAALLAEIPDLPRRQKIQDPAMIYFSTDIRDVANKFPYLAAKPNTVFQLNVPRTRINNGIHIEGVPLENVINQAEYPIQHAINNHGNPGESFSRTNTFYIETGEMDHSLTIAHQVMQRHWMADWMELPGNKILIAKTRTGRVEDIQTFNPQI